MEDYPKTILEFEKRFATEEACKKYLLDLRWSSGFECPRCAHKKAWPTKRGTLFCTNCKHQISATAGTIFENTRTPLKMWFRIMWHVVAQKNGISAKGLQRVLGISRYETMWLWLHKLRNAMVRPERDRLSGLVEIDETYIGGKHEGKRGRGASGKSLVIIAVEDKGKSGGFGRIRLAQIADASAICLIPTIKDFVEIGSTVRTDGWSGYARLAKEGYEHSIARKTEDLGKNLLPLAHRIAALLKRWLNGTHQGAVESSHLSYYLDEFTFRFNRRTSRSRGKLFYRLLQQAVMVEPITNDRIRTGRLPVKPKEVEKNTTSSDH